MASTLNKPRMAAIVSAVLGLALALSMAVGTPAAFALGTGGLEDDGSASITVHKYRTLSSSNLPGTGADDQKLPTGAEPLSGVAFTLYQLDTAKVEGAVSGVAPVASAPSADGVAAFLATYQDSAAAPKAQTTDVDGKAVWSSLPFGYYLLVETNAGGANVEPAVPSLITLPYAKQAEGGATSYLKDVHVYPKNVSLEEVEKTILNEPDVTSPGETLSYQISFKVPAAGKVYQSDAKCMTGSVVDRLPLSASGQPTLTMKGDYSAVALAHDGTETPLVASDLGFVDSSTSDGTVTWSITPAIAKAVEGVNTAASANASKQVAKVVIRANATVNDNAYGAAAGDGGQPALRNVAAVTLSDADGTVLLDRKEGVSPAIPTAGFSFTKVDAEGKPITADTATFKVAATYADATAGTFIRNGSADLQATTSVADGKAVMSGLNAAALTSGGQPYTAMSKAVENARANLGVVQRVELWLVETDAPNGYRILQAPQKVTIDVVKATKDAKVSTTAEGAPLSIVNARNGESGGGNFALPNTGGMGAFVFVAAGAVLVALAVAGLARSRSRDRHERS